MEDLVRSFCDSSRLNCDTTEVFLAALPDELSLLSKTISFWFSLLFKLKQLSEEPKNVDYQRNTSNVVFHIVPPMLTVHLPYLSKDQNKSPYLARFSLLPVLPPQNSSGHMNTSLKYIFFLDNWFLTCTVTTAEESLIAWIKGMISHRDLKRQQHLPEIYYSYDSGSCHQRLGMSGYFSRDIAGAIHCQKYPEDFH